MSWNQEYIIDTRTMQAVYSALSTDNWQIAPAGSLLYLKDKLGTKLESDGTAWQQISQAGAKFVSNKELAFGPIYTDGMYKYFGEATPGTALTAAAWRVSRMKISDSQIQWVDGNANFDNVFTSLAVVSLLSFS